ncbi:hypothetical protein [Methylobacterium radiodurans]|uniref:Uncharacterized protein n=1 Tax=Methylobacterium radiodurans TaxID=2202828 RepID=A0A2U8VYP3_9HYPH|nr:hypothetical protein [Methylobacterium radiodurans]AWN38913.1 hypothetical protein DK427_08335 [Methylobacterium radiodurans]
MPRRLSWTAALRDLKTDRETRAEVREERLRTVAGLRGSPALALSAWRGRSGKRYVVGVQFPAVQPADLLETVVLAVVRDAAGLATILRATHGLTEAGARSWLDSVRRAGANEIHTHRLAEDNRDAAAIVVDLTERAQVAA